MRRVFFILLISSLLGTPAWSAEETPISGPDFTGITVLDLQTAQRMSLEENPGIAAARARFEQARARVAQATGAWWPSIDLSGQAMRTRRSDIAYESAQQFDVMSGQSTDRNIESSTASLQGTWVLFDGFFRSFLQDQMEFGEKSFDAARLDSQRRLVSAVAEAFLNAQLTQTKVKIAAADKEFYEKQLVDAENRFNAGAGAWGDVLNIRVQLNSALTSLMLEKRRFEAAKYGLAALLGVTNATFPESLHLAELDRDCTTVVDQDAQKLIDEALAARPDLNRLSFQVQEAEAATGKAKAPFWPKIQLAGALNGSNQDSYSLQEDNFGNYIALNASWNLFSGGTDRAKLFEARQKKREAVYNLADQRNTVVSEVRQYIALLAAAAEQVRLQRESVILVEENRKLARSEYDAGASSLVRLNEAQRDLTTTYSRLAQALVSYHLARERLLAATGRNLALFSDAVANKEQASSD